MVPSAEARRFRQSLLYLEAAMESPFCPVLPSRHIKSYVIQINIFALRSQLFLHIGYPTIHRGKILAGSDEMLLAGMAGERTRLDAFENYKAIISPDQL